jgi:hypothetical protein
VPGAGHDVQITHPAAVAHAITNLLRDVTTSAHPTSSRPPASTR